MSINEMDEIMQKMNDLRESGHSSDKVFTPNRTTQKQE